ncbi:hypothetical protein F7649_10590 [Tenacibaculum piscium]|uniref:hypothetical protein n=1 Tax=Tenacibaculum piscium TaxID=1458515 RepID=UPI00187B9E63|nr:hypothetical protein [Tenacibaculum piscium]MBE7671559.1 hypothetical protein [Tenacibaculum piscium]
MKNTKQNIKKTGAFLADNTKEVLYISGGIVLLLVGYKIYKGLGKAGSKVKEALEDDLQKVNVDLKIDPNKLTITKEDAQKYAQQLLYACDYSAPIYGTDTKSIKKVFEKLKSPEDFKLVHKSFGLKKYNGYGLSPEGIFRHLDNGVSKDLVYWLKEELSTRDGDVYTIVKNRIESANWTF